MINAWKDNATMKVPVKSWAVDLEKGAFDQANNLAELPFAFHHVALMADCHQGYGMPIGGVLATKDVIIPNAVGVDIGCGMIAVRTSLISLTQENLKDIIGEARKVIPTGFKHQAEDQWDVPIYNNTEIGDMLLDSTILPSKTPIVFDQIKNKKVGKQLGTLGGGNHFIEVQQGDDVFIWLMIHSGSRNVGKQVCDYYNGIADEINRDYHSVVPSDWDLAFLPAKSKFGIQYFSEMEWCLRFAQVNRELMMQRLQEVILKVIGDKVVFSAPINIHHNYVALEHHFGEDVYVHRKGAIRMPEGATGIIPSSMGTPSYIVKGLGNPHSFMSASHGAGRKMGRNDADKTITEEEANKSMEGVVFGRWNKNRKGGLDLSECPLAYKNIDAVMEAQKDLVEPIVKLTPLAVMKG